MAFNNMDMGSYFYVGPRFCELKPLGYGGGGVVYSAVDSECDKSVAIKKVSLETRSDCKRAIREVRILRKLQHENILKIHDVIYPLWETRKEDPKNASCFQSIYIIQELTDTDLRHLLEEHRNLSTEHTRLLCYQMFRGLKYLHSANVIHRDLKPENLLINMDNLMLKIGDFGMARILDPYYPHKGHLTQNVSTQWYRSPEQMIHPMDYTKSIDMWSCGCIVAEMVLGKPLFCGDHDLEQMLLILETVPLTDVDMNKIICTLPSKLLKNYAGYPRHPLENCLHQVDKLIQDLLKGLLTFDPLERLTTTEALSHQFFKVFACVSDEPICNDPFFIEDEIDGLSPNILRNVMFEEQVMMRGDSPKDKGVDVESEDKQKEEKESEDDEIKRESDKYSKQSDSESDGDEKRVGVKVEEDEKHSLCKGEELSEKSENEDDEKSDEDVKLSRILDENIEEESNIKSQEQEDFVMKYQKILEDSLKGGGDSAEEEGAEKSEIDDMISEKSSSVEDISQDLEKSDLSEKAELEISCTKEKVIDLTSVVDNSKLQDEISEDEVSSNKSKEKSAILSKLGNVGTWIKDRQSIGECLPDDVKDEKVRLSSLEPAVRRKIKNSSMTRKPLCRDQKVYEKTLDYCLQEFSHLSARPMPHTQHLPLSPDGVNPIKPIHVRNLERRLQQPQVLDLVSHSIASPANNKKLASSSFREMLYVEIPSSNLQVELARESPKNCSKVENPKNSPRGVRSSRTKPKAGMSPRDKSVRPKRKNSKIE